MSYYVESQSSPSTVLSRSSRARSGNCGVARARVKPITCAAPACFKARAQAESVAPVVITSSTSTMQRPRTSSGLGPQKLRADSHAARPRSNPFAVAWLACGAGSPANSRRRSAALPLQRSRQARRQQFRLIKAALTPARRVQGNRNDDARNGFAELWQRIPSGRQQFPQAHAQSFVSGKLHAQNHEAKFASIKAKAARPIEARFICPALAALRHRRVEGARGRERQPATPAQGSAPGFDAGPAGLADAQPPVARKLTSAKGAVGGKRDGKNAIHKSSKERRLAGVVG